MRRFLGADGAALLIFLLASTGVSSAWRLGQSVAAIDYYRFWLMPQVVTRGESTDIYAANEGTRLGRLSLDRALAEPGAARQKAAARYRTDLDIVATPFLFTVFWPLGTGSYERDYTLFQALSLAAGVSAIVSLARMLGYSWPAALAALALALWAFEPLRSDIRVGNVNQLQLAGLALYLLLQRRGERAYDLLAGAWLGLLTLFKPNLGVVPAAVLCALLFENRLDRASRQLAGLVIGAAGALGASIAFFGSADVWWQWRRAVPLVVARMEISLGNYSLARLVADTVGIDLQWPLLAACTVSIALLLWRSARARQPGPSDPASNTRSFERTYLAVALAAAASLLSAALVWLHYFTLLLPLALYALRPSPGSGASVGASRLLAVLALAILPGGLLPALLGLNEPVQSVVECTGASVILFACGLWGLQQLSGTADSAPTLDGRRRRASGPRATR